MESLVALLFLSLFAVTGCYGISRVFFGDDWLDGLLYGAGSILALALVAGILGWILGGRNLVTASKCFIAVAVLLFPVLFFPMREGIEELKYWISEGEWVRFLATSILMLLFNAAVIGGVLLATSLEQYSSAFFGQ